MSNYDKEYLVLSFNKNGVPYSEIESMKTLFDQPDI